MYYHEINDDLFKYTDQYVLAHCISSDFALGAGIAKEFDKRYQLRYKLHEKYGELKGLGTIVGSCILIDNIFNLITKQYYYQKPTYPFLKNSLEKMKTIAIQSNINKIAMPCIGCGLDKLKWNQVSEIIKEIFQDTDIEILICIKSSITSKVNGGD